MTPQGTALTSTSDVLEAVRHYHTMGWAVVPVLFRDKAPGWNGRPQRDWGAFRFGLDQEHHFLAPTNVGVMVGDRSNHLTDVDLDCPEAVELAPRFLPSSWTFGRSGKARSHWLYRAEGAAFEVFRDVRRQGDKAAATLVELRAGQDEARQTVFPPSVHRDTGEAIEWTAEGRRCARGSQEHQGGEMFANAGGYACSRGFDCPPQQRGCDAGVAERRNDSKALAGRCSSGSAVARVVQHVGHCQDA